MIKHRALTAFVTLLYAVFFIYIAVLSSARQQDDWERGGILLQLESDKDALIDDASFLASHPRNEWFREKEQKEALIAKHMRKKAYLAKMKEGHDLRYSTIKFGW